LVLQVKKPGTKKAPKNAPKGVAKGSAGGKKKKSTLKYTIDCTHPVEDGIMDPANFVRLLQFNLL
jgi:large subunit ribosomal protein L22e